MSKMITCFLAGGEIADLNRTIGELRKSAFVSRIFVLDPKGKSLSGLSPDTGIIAGGTFSGTATLREIVRYADTGYMLLYTKSLPLNPGPWAPERMVQVAEDTVAGFGYPGH